jgi:cysteine synthase A
MFALEWCEFCWSVRKLFAEAGIPFRSVDLDSVEYQKDNWGGDIRVALRKRLGSPTIPQIFVGSEYIGGASETFDAFNDGGFQAMLEKNAVDFDRSKAPDAYSFLPKWLHPR